MSKIQPDLIEKVKNEPACPALNSRKYAKEVTKNISPSERTKLRQEYLEALKSGKHSQTIQTLRNTSFPHAFCAVGLAYEVMGGDWSYEKTWIYEIIHRVYGLKIAGLIKMNDEGYSFKRIASIMENEPWSFWEDHERK